MTDSSPFTEAVSTLCNKLGTDKPTSDLVGGAQEFVNEMVNLRDGLYDDNLPVVDVCSALSPGGLKLDTISTLEDPRRELYTLYIRAFQCLHPRAHLRSFISAIDNRLTKGPIDLERVDPLWCNPSHALYMHCWRTLTRESATKKKLQKDATVGRALFGHLLTSLKQSTGGVPKSFSGVIDKVRMHDTSMALVTRLMQFVKQGDTNDMVGKSIAHARTCMKSVDMARIVRDGMKLAQQNGINPQESLMQLTQMTKAFGGQRRRKRR